MIETKADVLNKDSDSNIPMVNDLAEGSVIGQDGSVLFIDLSPFRTGVIYGREFNNAKEIIKSLKLNDKITAKVLEVENENGYVSLSLKEAKQEIVWREAEEIRKGKACLSIPIVGANKGGLILEWKGIQGFLPASHLKVEHYPRIQDGDKDKIEEELKKLIGEKIKVTVLSINQKENKLIFSEKSGENEEIKEIVSKYKIGDIVEGEITGVVDFGIFVKIVDNLEGLVHISELDWALIENPADIFKVGQKVKTQIINIVDGKISLSIKILRPNPWDEIREKYNIGDIVKGVVIKFNKHGALISIEEGIAGLAHISEFSSEKNMKEKIELGKTYPFQISLFEPKEHRLILKYLAKE
ncbi:S1 RNA-binding domain-containing protein [Candidatus Parcubacteria bacterium]|nr:S1 RNA-binding domain-containing protein [Patescibacteria group bacterium]MCG2699268.1 S1 RNA-binding domain-containing protein [Candidatus Parcubacteria bacterium]